MKSFFKNSFKLSEKAIKKRRLDPVKVYQDYSRHTFKKKFPPSVHIFSYEFQKIYFLGLPTGK